MNLEVIQSFEENTRLVVPKFKVEWKDESRWQKAIGAITGLFNPKYMTQFVSTFYPKVYFPSREFYYSSPIRTFTLLAHERMHLIDSQNNPIWFSLSYMLPQVLAVPCFVLGGFGLLLSWKAFLSMVVLGLVCLAPWPSPWRASWEAKGYAMTLAINNWVQGGVNRALESRIREHFLGWDYYRMVWGSRNVDRWLSEVEQAIDSGVIWEDPDFKEVHRFLHENVLKSPKSS